MFNETMALISLAMFAMLFYRVTYIRFLAPMWIILFVILGGRAATGYGLITILMFSVLLMFFVLDAIRTAQNEAAKNREEDEEYDEEEDEEEEDEEDEEKQGEDITSDNDDFSDLPRLCALADDKLAKNANNLKKSAELKNLIMPKKSTKPKKAVKPKKTKLTVFKGVLNGHGFAPYNDVEKNDKSYFVDCGGKKTWGIGLKDAIKNSGAEIGDTIRFWKEAEVITKKARIFDGNGKVTGCRTLSQDKRRGVWVMEVVSN